MKKLINLWFDFWCFFGWHTPDEGTLVFSEHYEETKEETVIYYCVHCKDGPFR